MGPGARLSDGGAELCRQRRPSPRRSASAHGGKRRGRGRRSRRTLRTPVHGRQKKARQLSRVPGLFVSVGRRVVGRRSAYLRSLNRYQK